MKTNRFNTRLSISLLFGTAATQLLMMAGCTSAHVHGPVNPPTVTIAASPAMVSTGSSASLSVSATNADQVTVSGSDGSSYTLSPSGGTQAVTPKATTMYTATAVNTGGKVTATATVTVNGSTNGTTVTIVANPTSITAGGSSTLTITTTGATQLQVAGSDGTSYAFQPTGGTQTVSPTTTTTYTATATGAGGAVTATATVTVVAATASVSLTANPPTVMLGSSSTLTVTAANATAVTLTGADGSSYTLQPAGGAQSVTPNTTTTYTATAAGASGNATATATVRVIPANSVQAIQHVVFMLQENHSFDNYFGMLNPYRKAKGWNVGDDGVDYEVDGIDDKLSTTSNQNDEGASFSLFKLKSTCVDDMSSDWLASFGDVNRWDFSSSRKLLMDGFVHDAEGFAKSCVVNGAICSGNFTDLAGLRAMGYYDQGFLNYYYYMASQFAISDRWFSPVASRSIDNRIATFSGGTTQGLVKDPGDDRVGQLDIRTIFQELDENNVSWRVYYTVTQGFCTSQQNCGGSRFPATDFSNFVYSNRYLYNNPSGASCNAPTQASSVVGDSTNSFCIDPTHIAPLSAYYTDVQNGTLPAFAFIEAGYANNDEHPGSGQSVLLGQAASANIINALMNSSSWMSSAFFFTFDEGGGPYDHVPPVPGHSSDYTNASLGSIADISQIAVNPDSYSPCVPSGGTPTTHCDLGSADPGASPGDAAAQQGFAAQLGFRLPNFVVSPYARKHYVSHTPVDHTAVIKFVENRFIGPSAHLTARDAAQSNLLEFFDFSNTPWATPPSPPAPVTADSLGYDPCQPSNMGP